MIYQVGFTLQKEYLEQLTSIGLDGPADLIHVLVNQAMQVERDRHLNAKPFERSDQRSGYANSLRPRRSKR